MRKKALSPFNPEVEMPVVYRLYRRCANHDVLWWDGGLANQPHILMIEFEACEIGENNWKEQRKNIERILFKGSR